MRKIFGPKREEVTGDWRKLHDEELHDLYWSSDIIRVIKSRGMYWAQHVARVGEMRKANRGLLGKTNGKRPLRRPKRRKEGNRKIKVTETASLPSLCIPSNSSRTEYPTIRHYNI